MDNGFKSLIAVLLTDPNIAVPFWGAVGGLATSIIKKRRSILQILSSMILAALFANWFALALVQGLGLPTESLGGVGALLGITSYEITKVLVSGEWLVLLRTMIKNIGR